MLPYNNALFELNYNYLFLDSGRDCLQKKQIILLTLYPNSPGGVDTRAQAMSKYLSALHNVIIVRLKPPKKKLIIRLNWILEALYACLHLIRLLRDADVVISLGSIPNLLGASIARKSIVCITGSSFFSYESSLIARIYWTFILEPIYALMSTAIVPASPASLQPLLGGIMSVQGKVSEIYGFIDTQKIDSILSPGANSEILDVSGYFVFVGSLSHQKGIQELIKIYASLLYLNIPLVICGDGPLFDDCFVQCQRLSIEVLTRLSDISHRPCKSCIVFLGSVSNPIEIITNSKLLLCPYYWEGLSNTMLEGLYLNKPIIASTNPASLFLLSQLEKYDIAYGHNNWKLSLLDHPTSLKQRNQWCEKIKDYTFLDPICSSRGFVYDNFSAEKNIFKWNSLILSC